MQRNTFQLKQNDRIRFVSEQLRTFFITHHPEAEPVKRITWCSKFLTLKCILIKYNNLFSKSAFFHHVQPENRVRLS